MSTWERRGVCSCLAVAAILPVALLAATVALGQSAEDDEDQREATRIRIASFVDLLPPPPTEEGAHRGSPEKVMEVYNKWLTDNGSLVGQSYEAMSPDQRQSLHNLMSSLYAAAGEGEHAFKMVAYLVDHKLPEPSKAYREKGYPVDQIHETVSKNMAKARDAMIRELVASIGQEQKWRICISDSGNTESGMKSDLDQTVYVYQASPDGKGWIRDESLDGEFIRLFKQRWEEKHRGLSIGSLDIASIPGSSRFPDPRVVSSSKFVEAFKGTIDRLRQTPGAYTTYGAVVQQMQLRALAQIERENVRAFQVYGPEEGNLNGPWRRQEQFDQKLAMETMFYRGVPPELMTQHAFGASVANYFELLRYMNQPKFETKYHLRTWDDCLYTMLLLKRGEGRLAKRDYISLSAQERADLNRTILGDLFPGEADKQRQHALALEISFELRREHKGEPGAAEAVRQAEYLLAKDMFGDRFTPEATDAYSIGRTQTQLDAARQYYRRLASEFCLASIDYSSVDAFKLMLGSAQADPLLQRSRALIDPEGTLDWETFRKNMAEAARLTLLYAIYDLGILKSVALLRHINAQVEGHVIDLVKLWTEGQVIDLPRELANARQKARKLGERARTHVLGELGFDHAEEIRLSELITDHQNITWNWRKLANNMFNDAGTIDSLAQILLTFYETQGDMDQVYARAADEVFMTIPVVGQIEQLRRADMLQAAQIALALKYAAIGQAMVVYSIGSASYRIFEIEVREPYYGNAVDAVYRGFVGPELRDYGEPGKPPAPPVVFTEGDQKRADELEHEIARLATMLQVIETGKLPDRLPDNQDRVDLIDEMTGRRPGGSSPLQPYMNRQIEAWRKDKDKYADRKAAAERELAVLRTRERMWLWYRGGAWEGGVWSGIGARPTQQWLPISLLDEVALHHGFPTQGAVDFDLKIDLEAAEKRLGELRRQFAGATDLADLLDARADVELNELQLQVGRYQRAQRYLKEIETNRELGYRFRRDSLYRHFQQNKIDVDWFVEDWFTRNREKLRNELIDLGLFTPQVMDDDTIRPGPPPVETIMVSREIRDRVKERLKTDIERSRVLLAAYLKTEEARKQKQEENLVTAERLLGLERLGVALEERISEEDFATFLTALRYSAIPRFQPRVKATFFKAPSSPEAAPDRGGAKGERLRQPFRLDCNIQVDADPTLYQAPYQSQIHYLGASDGQVELLPDAGQAVAQLRQQHSQALREGDGVIAVASVFAARTPDLSGAISATIAGLPGLSSGGAGGKVLIGQAAAFIESKPVEVRVDPIEVHVTDQAGNRLSADVSKTLEVKLAGEDGQERLLDLAPAVTEPAFLGSHTFTKFGERVTIQVALAVADGSIVHGKEEVSIDDVRDWNDPACLEPIEIRLPILAAGLAVKGRVELRPKRENDSRYPRSVNLRMPEFEIDENVEITSAGKGSFRLPLQKPVKIHSQLQITAQAEITEQRPQADGAVAPQGIAYAGKGQATVPDEPGAVDFGTIVLVPSVTMVRIPSWDSLRPPTGETYLGQLSALGLVGAPRIARRPPDAAREFCVESVDPPAGTEVLLGTRVAVAIYDEFACRVPDVVGMKAADAVKCLQETGLRQRVTVGQAAETVDREFHVQSQGVEPGAKCEPGTEIPLVLFGKTIAMVEIPDVRGQPLAEAVETIRRSGLSARVDPERVSPGERDLPGAVARQEPRGGTRAEPGSEVLLHAFAEPGMITPDETVYPYYQLFQLYTPKLKDEFSHLIPRIRDGESKGEFFERKKAFLNSQPLERFHLERQQSTIVMHASGDALLAYPPSFFRENEKYFMDVLIEENAGFRGGAMRDGGENSRGLDRALSLIDSVFHESPDIRLPLASGFLLVAQGRFSTLDELNRAAPAARGENGEAERAVLLFREGKQTRRSPSPAAKTAMVFGPVTPGWTEDNIRLATQITAICFVATAVYGDPDAPQVLVLRQFRDRVLLATEEGRDLVRLYYHHGPDWAAWVLDHRWSRRVLRPALDLIASSIESVDIDSPAVRAALDRLVRLTHQAVRAAKADALADLPPLAARFRSAAAALEAKGQQNAVTATPRP